MQTPLRERISAWSSRVTSRRRWCFAVCGMLLAVLLGCNSADEAAARSADAMSFALGDNGARSQSRERINYEYACGPLLADGQAAFVQLIVVSGGSLLEGDFWNSALRFIDWEESERWRMQWLRRKVAVSAKRLQLRDEGEEQGETYTNWLVSLDPLVVVTTRGSTYPRVDGPLRWASDGDWIRPLNDVEEFEQRLLNDRLLLTSGLIASHVLDGERPIRWYSPTRRIKPRMIEDDGGDTIELDTGKERFLIERIEGRWAVERLRGEAKLPSDP